MLPAIPIEAAMAASCHQCLAYMSPAPVSVLDGWIVGAGGRAG
jgi:hypothetical protein